MALNFHIHSRASGMEDKRYTLHYFRVGRGGEPPYGWDGYGRLRGVRWMEVLGRGQQIRIGVTASAAASNGSERSRDTAFIEVDA